MDGLVANSEITRSTKCIVTVKISVNNGRQVEVKALMANASHVSSISEPLAKAVGLHSNGHVFVAGYRTPTFPVAAPRDAVNVEFQIVDSNGECFTKTVKIAPVIVPNKPHNLVLAKDWITSFIDANCSGQEYSPACSFYIILLQTIEYT